MYAPRGRLDFRNEEQALAGQIERISSRSSAESNADKLRELPLPLSRR
jgi:hypothetical protein